mmetsp:Transcript_47988/g.95767  ORF Transcript_47988/g.95767 Transcript_47988/m.95767 type:complete len:114 (-) Transcript_47988:162-503(-)
MVSTDCTDGAGGRMIKKKFEINEEKYLEQALTSVKNHMVTKNITDPTQVTVYEVMATRAVYMALEEVKTNQQLPQDSSATDTSLGMQLLHRLGAWLAPKEKPKPLDDELCKSV